MPSTDSLNSTSEPACPCCGSKSAFSDYREMRDIFIGDTESFIEFECTDCGTTFLVMDEGEPDEEDEEDEEDILDLENFLADVKKSFAKDNCRNELDEENDPDSEDSFDNIKKIFGEDNYYD